jgi:hypothetical protein
MARRLTLPRRPNIPGWLRPRVTMARSITWRWLSNRRETSRAPWSTT